MHRDRRLAGRRIRRRRRIAARLDAVALDCGLHLLPWQRDYAVAWLDGERLYVSRGSRGGWSTLDQVARAALADGRRVL